jgi:RNA polymerase sigma factor (sigma-70 family)
LAKLGWGYYPTVDESPDHESIPRGAAGLFVTTHWSVVQAAGDTELPQAREALEKLCRAYWYPLYAYIRRKGHEADAAQDLTQEFFARLIAKNYLSAADRHKGKFRSFLLGSLEHFLAREWSKARAQKRGGGQIVQSLDAENFENRYRAEPAHALTAEAIFERRWATTLLEQAMSRLRAESEERQKTELFGRLEPYLSGEKGEAPYASVAATLQMSEGAVKVAVHRLRQRYGELVREEIAHTVETPEEMEEELRHLFAVLRG